MNRSISDFVRQYLLLISCSVVILIASLSIYSEISRFKKESQRLKKDIIEVKKHHVKHQVESAIFSIEYLRVDLKKRFALSIKERVEVAYNRSVYLYNTYKNTKSESELKDIIKTSLRSDRFFNGRGYYYIFRKDGLGILSPLNTKYEDVNLCSLEYHSDLFPIVEILKKFKTKDEFFIKYKWTKHEGVNSFVYDKTAYLKKLPFYDWVLGTGDYIEDIEKDIQNLAIKKLLTIKYDEFGYVFVNKYDGTALIIHSDKYKAGDNISDIQDINGVFVFKESLKQAKKKKGGFISYVWYEPMNNTYKDDLSFVKSIPEWEWFVGAFTDISLIDDLILKNKNQLYDDLLNRSAFTILLLCIIILIIFILSAFMKKRLDTVFLSLYEGLKNSIENKEKIDISKLSFKESIILSEQVNVFLNEQNYYDSEIKNRQKFLQTLLDSIPLIVFYKDTKGIYLGCNARFCSFVNKKEEELIGKSLYEVFSKEQADVFKKADDELFASRGVQVYDTEMASTDGQIRNVNFHKSLFYDEQENVAGMLGIMIDITERIKTQNKLLENEKNLIKLNTTKDRFFSIIAHDLKNPFNSLMGLLDILIDEYDDITDDTKKEYLSVLNRSSNDLFGLLTNLLEWSRTQTSSIEFNPVMTDLSDLVTNEIKLLEAQAIKKVINIEFNLSNKLMIMVDKNMMSTVVRNILSNSIKFTSIGGNIAISLQEIDNHIRISIKDDGVGISEENQQKLFKISEKISSIGTANETGTGLGLILCKEFIDKHNGCLFVVSKKGKGSIFNIDIPK